VNPITKEIEMATDQHIFDVIERLTRCWDVRNLDATLNFYTKDVEYLEPGSGVNIKGRTDLRAYLVKYFAAWDSRWTIQHCLRLAGQDAAVAFWDMEVWRPGSDLKVMTRGMDLLKVRGDQIMYDEVYFDRTQLKPLFAANPRQT
jgi:ketosteroid isomerase-like protein